MPRYGEPHVLWITLAFAFSLGSDLLDGAEVLLGVALALVGLIVSARARPKVMGIETGP